MIKYYNEYNIIESGMITDVKNIKTITSKIDNVTYLLLLKDGRIALCLDDKTIRIYDPSNAL